MANFLKQSQLELLELLKREIEKLKCDETKIKVFGDWVVETYEDKMLVNAVLQDVLDLLKTNQE